MLDNNEKVYVIEEKDKDEFIYKAHVFNVVTELVEKTF